MVGTLPPDGNWMGNSEPPGISSDQMPKLVQEKGWIVASILKDSTLCFLNNACKHLSCLPFRFSIGNRRKHLKIGFIRSVRE